MRTRWMVSSLLAVVLHSIVGGTLVRAGEPAKPVEPKPQALATANAPKSSRQAIERGLSFLVDDVAKWRADKGCATCHHGTMSVWALSEARAQGYGVDTAAYEDILTWTREQRASDFHPVRDPRPGWNLASIPLIYLGAMSERLPILSRQEVSRVALHLARHQEQDGSFLLPTPARNGAPPIWESSESVALWALLAWEPSIAGDPTEAAEVRAGREKTVAWLSKVAPTNTPQTNTLRLLLDVKTGKSKEQLQLGIDRLFQQQNADGGWSQAKGLVSDAYATGQSLYALSIAGAGSGRPEIERAMAFLAATQRDDGSWPMIPRDHPGVVATKNPVHWIVPITYFGTAWGVLGLVRTVPSPPDTAPKQRHAFDRILAFHGKHDVDQTVAERPVVGVDLRYYELSDKEVGDFAKWLQAFPRLTSLQFKSTKITDAGAVHLKALPKLRALALENAAITDAALETLKDLSDLKALTLTGTKVTDAGVEKLKHALPELKIQR